jgi:hypothetical protein
MYGECLQGIRLRMQFLDIGINSGYLRELAEQQMNW